MNEIQPLIDALQAKLPWVAAITSVMGLARLLAKPLSALVQSFFSKLVLFIQGTPETDDDAWLEKVLASKAYRFFAFVVDWVLSIKLPSSASVQTLKAIGADDGNIAGRVGLFLLLGLLATGCGTPAQRAPSATELKYYDVKTNFIEVVAVVSNAPAAGETSNAQRSTLNVQPVTNRVEEYTFTPNAHAQLTANTGAAVGNIWGVGAPVGAGILGLFSLWGLWRSRKSAVASAAELAQIIETGRQVLRAMPNGEKYEAEWKAWMVKHQAETETIAAVSQLVANSVDNEKAKGAAQSIVNLIESSKG